MKGIQSLLNATKRNWEKLCCIVANTSQANSTLATLATETTLISVLNAIVASDQDIEILLVRDTGNGDEVVQQITNWETGTPVVTYKDVNGNPYSPVGPLEYLDASAVLNLILAESVDQGLTLDSIDTTLTSSVRTPTLLRTTTAGTIAVGTYSASILNAGGANGTLLGALIKPGETINIDAGAMNNTLSAIAYDATGTELLISTLI